ncbi:MAG TPA: hypothetical protein PLD19_02720, partial [Luteimonas sp.]|nr:hypothetical protein [Luteimonas sp.]
MVIGNIEALQRRLRLGRSIRPQRPAGEFPPGWAEWFAEDPPEAHRRVVGDIQEMLAVFLAREPVFPTGYRQLSDWQAFTRLWRYDWREAPAPYRGRRIASMTASVLLHLLWLQLMILFMVAHYPGEEEAERLGENITQVEFIGEGTPQDEGGGSQQAEQPLPEVAAAPAPAAAARAASTPEAAPPPPPPSIAEVEVTPEAVPPPVAEQPLVVTETPVPDSDFVLVPPRIDVPRTRTPATPELQVPTREVRVVDVPA